MTRLRWTSAEIEDVGLGWNEFAVRYPHRSYDAWEVKRRRLAGGSAGTDRRMTIAARVRLVGAVKAMRTLADYFAWVAERG